MKAMKKGDYWTSIKVSVEDILEGKQRKTEDFEELADYGLVWDGYQLGSLVQFAEMEAKAQHVQLGVLYESKMKEKSMKHYQIAAKIAKKLSAGTFQKPRMVSAFFGRTTST